jgi:hypothetical protein
MRFDCSDRHEDQTILRVNPGALDRAFAATSPRLYASVHPGKVAHLMALPADVCINAPSVGVYEGCLTFENGRHRARAALLLGLKAIPVIVDKDNVAEVRGLLARFKRARHRRGGGSAGAGRT